MARRKLKEYLDNPQLLSTITKEEMIAWAKEVPYAGLVQRLLAQKLAMESASESEIHQANLMTVLSNANPDHAIKSIDDFKNMVLKGSDVRESHEVITPDFVEDSNGESDDLVHVETTVTENPPVDTASLEEEDMIVEETIVTESTPSESDEEIFQTEVTLRSEDELSDFVSWLGDLKSIDQQKDEFTDSLELANRELASSSLAELLVAQGHYDRAIEMYEMLMLKNPQKSSFFAAQIEKLKAQL